MLVFQALRGRLLLYAQELQRRSVNAVQFFHGRMGVLALAWLAVFTPLALFKIAFAISPVHNFADLAMLVLPYLLIAIAPIAGYVVASGSFPYGLLCGQPAFRLAKFGKWQQLNLFEAQANPVFGPAGFMASLMIGMLINVVFRSFEFMLAVPAMNGHAPQWGQSLFLIMAADVIVMSFFYMVCFVMALRKIPLFPRMLLFAWALDIGMQLMIAEHISSIAGLPAIVVSPLRDLLEGNITKVLISAFVWLPYLLLSERVNVTYRSRTALDVKAS